MHRNCSTLLQVILLFLFLFYYSISNINNERVSSVFGNTNPQIFCCIGQIQPQLAKDYIGSCDIDVSNPEHDTKFERGDTKTDQISSENANIQHLKSCTQTHESIYTNEYKDLTLHEFQQKNVINEINGESKTIEVFQIENVCTKSYETDLISDEPLFTEKDVSHVNCVMGTDLPSTSNESSFSKIREQKKTMLFKENNDMSIDHPTTQLDNIHIPEPSSQYNCANMSLECNISTILMANKLKNVLSKPNNSLVTPVKTTATNQLGYITPRLSLIEFTAAERREGIVQNSSCFSSTLSEISKKRLPLSLTPLVSVSKRRQTLIFDDCLMDESNDNIESDAIEEKNKQFQETLSLSEYEGNGDVIEISGVCLNESRLQTPSRQEQRQSHIPIPVSSEKKLLSYTSQLNRSVDNIKEDENEQDLDGDNFVESIQLMRRTETLKQFDDQSTIRTNVAIKPSVFEENPITISDVSVFFDAHRKSKSISPQIMIGSTHEPNTKGVSAIEPEKTGLENRYINLTLDEIDKTCISLVGASYDVEDDNQSFSKCIPINDQSKTNVTDNKQDDEKNDNTDGNHRSINDLRNRSVLGRNCKRCRETCLNETTSSVSDTFVLPKLPPFPDLGLEYLRRLRKRPTISDVNVLWQRLSLDSTVMNVINISDDSHIISNLEHKYSPAAKCNRKCETDFQT